MTGATETFVDLNPANNVDEVAVAAGVLPDGNGEVTVALSPGPNNDNGNHFIYLGVMGVESTADGGPSLLFDWGGANNLSSVEVPLPENHWNNIPVSIGGNDAGELLDLVTADGTATGISFHMIARFNGANQNGSVDSTLFPVNATRDSLFGNTEEFSGLSGVFPSFRLSGLVPGRAYDLTFYASRLGVGDNRETRYTVTGAEAITADLDAANNIDESIRVEGVTPDAAGEIVVAITPGPNNSNGNHFTYLGVLTVEWQEDTTNPPSLSSPAYSDGVFRFTLNGTTGKTYQLVRRTFLDSGLWMNEGNAVVGTGENIELRHVNGAGLEMQYYAVVETSDL